jgi:hypothetical protein
MSVEASSHGDTVLLTLRLEVSRQQDQAGCNEFVMEKVGQVLHVQRVVEHPYSLSEHDRNLVEAALAALEGFAARTRRAASDLKYLLAIDTNRIRRSNERGS